MERGTAGRNVLADQNAHDNSGTGQFSVSASGGFGMRVVHLAPLAAMAALAACNSSPKVTADNATGEEVQKKVAAAGGIDMISPGRWEGVVHITEMKMPGLPPEAQARLAQAQGDEKIVSCVTPEDVKQSKASMFGDMGEGCKYDHFEMGGGKVDGTATCDRDGSKMKTRIAGTFSADTYHIEIRSEGTGAKATDNMTMAMSADAKRVGECRGTPDES
jgi:hypothetical protein